MALIIGIIATVNVTIFNEAQSHFFNSSQPDVINATLNENSGLLLKR